MPNLRRVLPPLNTLVTFEAAARLGSFTAVAAEMHVTQAAVSRQMRALEDNLGARLFTRGRRNVSLTAGVIDGRLFSDFERWFPGFHGSEELSLAA